MSTWLAGIVGFIIGWIAEWLMDLIYWRRRAEEPLAVSPTALHEKDQTIRDLQARLDERDEAIGRLEVLLAARDEEIGALSARVEQLAAGSAEDDLTLIKGIGPAYATALRQAGVTSFRQLARLAPERVREMINIPQWRKIEPESWIEQAARLSR